MENSHQRKVKRSPISKETVDLLSFEGLIHSVPAVSFTHTRCGRKVMRLIFFFMKVLFFQRSMLSPSK